MENNSGEKSRSECNHSKAAHKLRVGGAVGAPKTDLAKRSSGQNKTAPERSVRSVRSGIHRRGCPSGQSDKFVSHPALLFSEVLAIPSNKMLDVGEANTSCGVIPQGRFLRAPAGVEQGANRPVRLRTGRSQKNAELIDEATVP